MTSKKIIFISGRYSGTTGDKRNWHEIENNIRHAELAAIGLAKKGWVVICPHKNFGHLEIHREFALDFWLQQALVILERCDAVFMLEDWEKSSGSVEEHTLARELGLRIYYGRTEYPDVPE
jgi:hypothetical protein